MKISNVHRYNQEFTIFKESCCNYFLDNDVTVIISKNMKENDTLYMGVLFWLG